MIASEAGWGCMRADNWRIERSVSRAHGQV